MSTEAEQGVSWGEILELVSGRRELPPWPPFTIDNKIHGLGITGQFEQQPDAPMQKLDMDIPEEYRDHYVRQSKKTKLAVQSWLKSQPELPSSPPQEVDDETLTFAMLTHLEPEQRPFFTALMRGLTSIPASRAPTPLHESPERSEVMTKTSVSLQRLYRLSKPPRDPECAMYLLKNLDLHSVVATLAAVSPHEWEILISGRFDGFLWSGAESLVPPSLANASPVASRNVSRNAFFPSSSRTTTPFSQGAYGGGQGPPASDTRTTTPLSTFSSTPHSRNPTPFTDIDTSNGPTKGPAPVQLDEDTEIAVLAEVEREIYLGMEALEDAFEALHTKAESVRRSLRERAAGLSIAAQARRGSTSGGVEVRLGTPANDVVDAFEGMTDDGLGDDAWSLAPDDSASNISSRRRRKGARRRERGTPAMVEEEEEGEFESETRTEEMKI